MMKEKTHEVIIYKSSDGLSNISVQLKDETIWLITQRQIVELFQIAKSTVSEHIKNIFSDGELLPEATVRKIRTVQKEGNRENWNIKSIRRKPWQLLKKITSRRSSN